MKRQIVHGLVIGLMTIGAIVSHVAIKPSNQPSVDAAQTTSFTTDEPVLMADPGGANGGNGGG
ncbi:hypothetical protein [Herpetosiphon giganteus]|uniref:hypothetical protein n=1 Tax=Herpetosiphon giganteus TaxID=2029754 RepID=UPI00195AFBEC|nr:hypothetical protein [Herpetosiphon giganteus]MBM7845696.1 hypothetical protein [Herpetosiphon giganteus]